MMKKKRMTVEVKKEKHISADKNRNKAALVTHFFCGMGAPVEFWSYTPSPKRYPGNDIQDAWSEVGNLLTEAVKDFGQKESA